MFGDSINVFRLSPIRCESTHLFFLSLMATITSSTRRMINTLHTADTITIVLSETGWSTIPDPPSKESFPPSFMVEVPEKDIEFVVSVGGLVGGRAVNINAARNFNRFKLVGISHSYQLD